MEISVIRKFWALRGFALDRRRRQAGMTPITPLPIARLNAFMLLAVNRVSLSRLKSVRPCVSHEVCEKTKGDKLVYQDSQENVADVVS